jgi:hypothetical protein
MTPGPAGPLMAVPTGTLTTLPDTTLPETTVPGPGPAGPSPGRLAGPMRSQAIPMSATTATTASTAASWRTNFTATAARAAGRTSA